MARAIVRTARRIVTPLAVLALASLAAPLAASDQMRFVTPTDSLEVKGAPVPAAPVRGGGTLEVPTLPNGLGYLKETEPNGTPAEANPLGGNHVVALGSIFPGGDNDYWSFSGSTGDRVYIATQTSFSANGSSDSQLTLYSTDGTTVIEFDDDNGTFGSLSSTIAGATLPATGTFYIKVNHFTASTGQLRPYVLYFDLHSGSPDPEVEPNDGTPQPLPPSGWISGSTSSAADLDFYELALNAGDTVFVSLDLDPERDAVTWNGWTGLAPFGSPPLILVASDAGTSDAIPSEAFFMTVKDAGLYDVLVSTQSGATTFGTYHLSVSVFPAVDEGVNCTTYTSVDSPQSITDAGLTTSTITIPGNPRIADVDVAVELTHSNMPDLDVQLVSPAGNDNGLFTDIGSNTQTGMNAWFDDEGGIPPLYSAQSGMVYQPELSYRLSWLDGEDAGGTWTLAVRDDTANSSTGTLTSWSLRVCEQTPAPACAPGMNQVVVYSSDFEADDGGFTHSGTQDEWARGLPASPPISSCNSGSNCWKTDLTGTYNASSSQDLLSPPLDFTGLVGPIVVTWSQRYQMESASFDHFNVTAQEVGNPANAARYFEWDGATMTNTVGTPSTTIAESAGWSQFTAQADFLAGLQGELLFHLDSDTSGQFAGAAIDDVTVTACEAPPPLPPDIDVSPASLSSTLPPGATDTQNLSIGNLGEQDLHWTIVEEPTAGVRGKRGVLVAGSHGGGDLGAPARDQAGSRTASSGKVVSPAHYESPADFSEGFDDITLLPGLGWFFQNNSNPLGTTNWFQGNSAVFPAQSGAATSYIGANYNNTAGVGTISNWMLTPEVAMADGDTVAFWTRTVDAPAFPDRLQVRLSTNGASTNVGADENSVGDFTTLLLDINPTLTTGGYPNVWTQYMITLSGIPPGATGRIGFRYYVTDAGPSGNNSDYIGIDTFEYVAGGGSTACQTPADVPWLSVSPAAGTTVGGGVDPVDVTFDATGLNCGSTYTANLCVESDDPDPGPGNGTSLVVVPVDLTIFCEPDIVVDPASLSSLMQPVDTQVVVPMDIMNVGNGDLTWDITEDAGLLGDVYVAGVPGRQQPIHANRQPWYRNEKSGAPGSPKGDNRFARAEADGPARKVTPERPQVPDATVTITHSATQNIVSGNSVSCNNGVGHTDNSYIRRFSLTDFGISGAFSVTQVDVGIEQATGSGGTQPATVNLYTWNPVDPFTFANFVPIGTANTTVPDQSLTIITVPVTGDAPAGSTLVVEFFTPDGTTVGNLLWVGSNADGQTDATFLAAADCGVLEPTDVGALGFPGMMLVMNVTGTTGCDVDLPWVSASPAAGVTGPGATTPVDVTFDSTGLALGGVYTGSLCVHSDDPDTPTVLVPLTLEVDSMPFLDGFETGDTSRWSFLVP